LSKEQSNYNETPFIEIISRRISYTIVPHIEEDHWRRQCKQTQIFDFQKDTTDSSSVSDSEGFETPSSTKRLTTEIQISGTKSRPSFKNMHLKETGRHLSSSEMGKRPPTNSQGRLQTRGNNSGDVNSQNKASSKDNFLINFAKKLADSYKERKPADKEVIFISLPNHQMSIKTRLEQLNGSMMNPDTKEPIQAYQEISVLLKLGTECLAIYRDQSDSLLIIYFKRLKNESLDSLGHQFSVIQTQLADFRDRLVEEYPIKLRLLMKDISQYINKQELLERVSRKGQNLHYFIFTPDHLGSLGKKSIAFQPSTHRYEMHLEDMSMNRFGSYGTKNSVVNISMPPVSFALFFDFDFQRYAEKFEGKMGFVESYEKVLRNERGESFVQERSDIARFIDYMALHKKYCRVVEDMISTMKEKSTVKYFNNDPNYLLFDIAVVQSYLDDLRQKFILEPWFQAKLLENKVIFYTAINFQYKITNILDLPPTLAKNIGWSHSSGSLLGLFAYHSQDEYTKLLRELMMNDCPLLNNMK
jgi:hypothetical protein